MTLMPIATLIALLLIFPRHHVRMEDKKVNDENMITLAVSEMEVQNPKKHQMHKTGMISAEKNFFSHKEKRNTVFLF